jgi:hypothetical protein
MMTLEETIELMYSMQKMNPKVNRTSPVGLYIETKMYQYYLDNYQINSADMLFETLQKYNLETVDKCKDKIPIIFECYEPESLKKFG